jgi:hypothetical protein
MCLVFTTTVSLFLFDAVTAWRMRQYFRHPVNEKNVMETSPSNQPQGFNFGNLSALIEIKREIFFEENFSFQWKHFFLTSEKYFSPSLSNYLPPLNFFPVMRKYFQRWIKIRKNLPPHIWETLLKDKKPFLLPPWLQSDTRVSVGQCQKETANVYYYLNCFHANLIIFKVKILTQ